MKTEPCHALTAQESARRVGTVLSAPDVAILKSSATRIARKRCEPFVALALPQLAALRSSLPSYVVEAIDGLIAAFQRWESDEKAVS